MSFWNWSDPDLKKSDKKKTTEFDHIEGEYGGVIQEGISDNRVYLQNKLEKEGVDKIFEIVVPKASQLALDYDTPELPARFQEALYFLVQTFCDKGRRLTYRVTQSRHGNLHVMIDLPRDISELERLAWHGVFGSDWKRNASALMCMAKGVHNNTLLIERIDAQPLATGVRTLDKTNEPARLFRRPDGNNDSAPVQD